eukprot:3940293-Rhodomonas_salina.2
MLAHCMHPPITPPSFPPSLPSPFSARVPPVAHSRPSPLSKVGTSAPRRTHEASGASGTRCSQLPLSPPSPPPPLHAPPL